MVSCGNQSAIDRNYKTNPFRIGEKYLEWVDDPLAPEDILESVTLYWLTETFPRAIYAYRQVGFAHRFLTSTRRSLIGKSRTILRHRFRFLTTPVGISTSHLDILLSLRSLLRCRARGLKPLETWYSGSSTRRYEILRSIECQHIKITLVCYRVVILRHSSNLMS